MGREHENISALYSDDMTIRLKGLLGVHTKYEWITFMDETMECCPFLKSRGKPSKEDIAKSIIGLSGYSKWKEYIVGELQWSVYTWDSWRRAYKLVLAYPYLRELEVTASQINTIYEEDRSSFPPDNEQWYKRRKVKAVKSGKKMATDNFDDSEKDKLILQLQKQVHDLEQTNNDLTEKVVLQGASHRCDTELHFKIRQTQHESTLKAYKSIKQKSEEVTHWHSSYAGVVDMLNPLLTEVIKVKKQAELIKTSPWHKRMFMDLSERYCLEESIAALLRLNEQVHNFAPIPKSNHVRISKK